MKTSWFFSWEDGNSMLELHNRTRSQAFQIARDHGWRPRCWYRPGTWSNFYIQG